MKMLSNSSTTINDILKGLTAVPDAKYLHICKTSVQEHKGFPINPESVSGQKFSGGEYNLYKPLPT